MDNKIIRTKKMMLWFAMGSIVMFFAGLTSAYVVSSSRKDWLKDFSLPESFYISTALIILSSLTLWLTKKSILSSKINRAKLLVLATFILGIGFCLFQIRGFSEFISAGYFFTGSQSNVTISFVYALVIAHLLHLAIGLVALLVVIYNSFKSKYNPSNTLGLDIASQFWHFLGILWLYLLVFFNLIS